MSIRSQANAQGTLTYSTGRPCRRNHMSERYASNGMCVECMREQAANRSIAARDARIIRNTALVNELRAQTFMVSDHNYDALLQFAQIMATADASVVEQCRSFASALHTAHHTLNAVTLSRFLIYQNNVIMNYEDQEIRECDENVYIKLGSQWYEGAAVMRVMRGQQAQVEPTIPELFK